MVHRHRKTITTFAEEKSAEFTKYTFFGFIASSIDDKNMKIAAKMIAAGRRAVGHCDVPKIMARIDPLEGSGSLNEAKYTLEKCRANIIYLNNSLRKFIENGDVSPHADVVLEMQTKLFSVNMGITQINFFNHRTRKFNFDFTLAQERALYAGSFIPAPKVREQGESSSSDTKRQDTKQEILDLRAQFKKVTSSGSGGGGTGRHPADGASIDELMERGRDAMA